tara:strand:- start:13832 stop:15049 length:1218 start_codon:yes stop_codon:yes gene_type:complete
VEVYLVGGAVRDELLQRPVRERDWVVVGAMPQQMLEKGYRQVGKDFPVFIHPETGEEYALARTERKTGKGYQGFSCYAEPDVTLEDDLKRRDLTINAMAKDDKGNIIDPYGGQKDLANRLLRHVSAAFVEDPLRVLRVARFAARYAHLDFKVADETRSLMQVIAESGELEYLVPERTFAELQKALGEHRPSEFFNVLRASHANEIIFPEIDNLFGVPQRADYHPEIDTGVHVMMVIDQAARLQYPMEVRFAALMHDLGKAITPEDVLPSHRGHEAAGVPLIEGFCERLKAPKNYKELAVIAGREHLHCHRIAEASPNHVVKTLERIDAFRRPERFELFLQVCEADARGRLGYEEQDYPQTDLFRKYYRAAAEVSTQAIIEDGYSGEKIATELHRRRVEAVKGVNV